MFLAFLTIALVPIETGYNISHLGFVCTNVNTAIAVAGFAIRKFEELDRLPWDAKLPQLVKADDFYWTLPEGAPFFPLSFALEAELQR